jgi:uncharacterized membrane protein/mono/diheme cytochrome c family protein
MDLLSLADFIGRFHPVFVHLPIGILLLACFFQLLTIRNRFVFLQPAIPVMVFWGMIGAILSCITGYSLSQTGDYEGGLVDKHQWLGIATAIVSLVLWIMYKLPVSERITNWMSVMIILLITFTGHLGGSLTHGEGYLTEGLSNDEDRGNGIKPMADIQEVVLYTDIVQPLLQTRCYSCHGPNKQKGKLRLDQQQHILKGGKDGKVIEPGKADESAMIERMLLPMSDEDHMPPKEKPQLTAAEISVLHWWVSTGADFTKKVKELPQTDKVKPALMALQTGSVKPGEQASDIPAEPVPFADAAAIERLKKAGVMVIPVEKNSAYLSVNFVTAGEGADSLVQLLEPLKKQILWLKLDHAKISDKSMQVIAGLTTLRRLHLSHTDVSDAGLSHLKSLTQLQSLNLVGTKVTANGLKQLEKIKTLKRIYLYQTLVGSNDWADLQHTFPGVQLDSGNYRVPTFATDTTEVKPPDN